MSQMSDQEKTQKALDLLKGERLPGDMERAIALYEEASEAGYSPAQFNLGCLYLNGVGPLDRNPQKALELLHLAAEQGDYDAMFTIAYIYDRGFLGEQDLESAFHWYEKAAQCGSARAQYDVAACHHHGRGVPVNLDLARRWYEEAAASGVIRAQQNLMELDGIPAEEPDDY